MNIRRIIVKIGAIRIEFFALLPFSSKANRLPASKFCRMILPDDPTREHFLLLLSAISSELLLISDPMLKLQVFGYAVMLMACETWNVGTFPSFEILSEFPTITDAALSISQVLDDFILHEGQQPAFKVYFMVIIGIILHAFTFVDIIYIYCKMLETFLGIEN